MNRYEVTAHYYYLPLDPANEYDRDVERTVVIDAPNAERACMDAFLQRKLPVETLFGNTTDDDEGIFWSPDVYDQRWPQMHPDGNDGSKFIISVGPDDNVINIFLTARKIETL